jgi:hypothetical protein
MNIICKSCGDLFEPWYIKLLLDGSEFWGPASDECDCFECFYYKNPPGSEPQWIKDLDELGCLDFMNR